MQDVNNSGNDVEKEKEGYENALFFLPNFSVNLKLLKQIVY